jgi:hypothetical protein
VKQAVKVICYAQYKWCLAWCSLVNCGVVADRNWRILLNETWLMKIFSYPFRPSHWGGFIERLQLLVVHSTALRNSKHTTPDAFLQLTSETHRVLSREGKTISHHEFHAVMFSGSLKSSVGQCHGASHSAVWLPIDLFLEDTMDGSLVTTTSAVENLISTSHFLCYAEIFYKLVV